ncbi:DBP2 [Symbiodinium sp. CCMP2592]|nr:DBP2 [Symbiodinium sp. CCMP2592]
MSGVPMATSASMSGVALAGFEADGYGSEYLRFSRGDPITWMPHAEEDENWAFGRIRDRTGWVPRTFFGKVDPNTAPGRAESTSSDSAVAAERERQADDDSDERCAQLERQIRVLKAVISEMRTSQNQKPSPNDKETPATADVAMPSALRSVLPPPPRPVDTPFTAVQGGTSATPQPAKTASLPVKAAPDQPSVPLATAAPRPPTTPKRPAPAQGQSRPSQSRPEPDHTPFWLPRSPSDYEPPHSGAEQLDYTPQPSPDEEKYFTREEVAHMLGTPAVQDWIRALPSFDVLASPAIFGGLTELEQKPLWATRVEALRRVPRLFEAIKVVKTESGLTWETAVSARRVLTQDGRVTIAMGIGSSYTELATPTKAHDLVAALFNKMWEEPSLARLFPTHAHFDLVATTIRIIYNYASESAGLSSRMIKLVPENPGEEAPKRMRIVHELADRQDAQPPSSSSKQPQQQGDEDQEGKRSRESGAPASSSSSSQRPREDWNRQWQSWQLQDRSREHHNDWWRNQQGSRR